MALEAEDGEIATEEAWGPLAHGEGPRVGVLGDSRCGKTEAQRRLIAAYLRRSPGYVYIVDTKEPQPQFEGQYRKNRAELENNPPSPDGPRPIVFRGERSDRDRNVIGFTFGIDRLLKQKRFAILFFDAAAKLPAHQRMHFLIFVHRLFDANQQAGAFEMLQMIVQVGIIASWNRR